MLARSGRIRWLDALESEGRRYEVFEDPGGASLLACTARGVELSYTTLLRLLGSLAQELREAGGERVSLHQLWIDRSWNLRVLDAAAGAEPGPPLAPMELLVATAKAMLPNGCVLPRDLPEHAEPVARRLFGLEPPFATVDDVRTALRALELRPVIVPRRTRALQIALGTGPVAIFGMATVGMLLWIADGSSMGVQAALMARSLVTGMTPAVDGERPDAPGVEMRPLTDTERAARELLIADWKRSHVERFIQIDLTNEERAVVDHAFELHPEPTDEELGRARSARGPLAGTATAPWRDFSRTMLAVPQIATLVWGFVAMAGAFLLRGGVTFALLDLRLRDRRGRRANRGWCILRSFLAWLAIALVYVLPNVVTYAALGGVITVLLLAFAVHASLVAASLADPARGLVDRVLGTRIVPK